VPSRFLFDEKLFDQEYFRERMRQSRKRERQQEVVAREMLRLARSHALVLSEEIDLKSLPYLTEDLDQLAGHHEAVAEHYSLDHGPSYQLYRRHIISLLKATIRFSAIAPLVSEERLDKVHRFVTLVFMEHDDDVRLYQLDNDILVCKA
jgi:hypothetical protein